MYSSVVASGLAKVANIVLMVVVVGYMWTREEVQKFEKLRGSGASECDKVKKEEKRKMMRKKKKKNKNKKQLSVRRVECRVEQPLRLGETAVVKRERRTRGVIESKVSLAV